MIFSVVVAFSIGLVVLFIIRNEVIESKTIMCGHKIYARGGTTVITLIKIRTACEPGSELTKHAIGATPEIADAIPIQPIPFRPALRKFPHLVSASANIPRFGYQLY